jgi:aryl-alcohol dehydrogenase-like predicted oxidoreductase
VVGKIRAFAESRGQTPAQLLVAWALAKQPAFVPLVGARTRAQLEGVLGALDKPLTSSEVEMLEALAPREAVAGTRYDARHMAHLDSER